MKKFLSLFMLLVCLCCFYGCKNEKNDDEIVFGVVGPFTGSLSTYGDSVRRGVELAVKDLNENGGLLGKKIRCLMEDDQGDSGQVLSAYNKLIDDVDFLFGEVTSGNSEILVAQSLIVIKYLLLLHVQQQMVSQKVENIYLEHVF